MAISNIQAQPATFTSAVEGVRVDALVTENGRPIAGLGAGDFDVRDNGVLQTIDLVRLSDVPISVVLACDVSGSVSGPRLAELQRAGQSLVGALQPADQVALITFSTAVIQRAGLTSDRETVRRGLAEAKAGGDTALVDAALGAMLLGDSDASRTLVVIFSDGVDTASFSSAERVLSTARTVNGTVYAVSTSRDTPPFLRELTEATGGRVLEIERGVAPEGAFLEILDEFRRRYVITYTPAGVSRGGWHTVTVRVAGQRRARVQARPGYVSVTK